MLNSAYLRDLGFGGSKTINTETSQKKMKTRKSKSNHVPITIDVLTSNPGRPNLALLRTIPRRLRWPINSNNNNQWPLNQQSNGHPPSPCSSDDELPLSEVSAWRPRNKIQNRKSQSTGGFKNYRKQRYSPSHCLSMNPSRSNGRQPSPYEQLNSSSHVFRSMVIWNITPSLSSVKECLSETSA